MIIFSLQSASSLSILYKDKNHSYDSDEVYKTFKKNESYIISFTQQDNPSKEIKDIYVSFYGSGSKIYEYYGHVGLCIEYQDNSKKYYDYGTFDFNAPHFIYNAVRGFMHYSLSESKYDFMKSEAQNTGRTYRCYKLLNLDQSKKEEIEQFLAFNNTEERRKYNYDFFYDNCSTRIREILNRAYDNKLENKKDEHSLSLRRAVASQTYTHKAVEMFYGFFGGVLFDKNLDYYEMLFIPEYLEGALLENNDIELVDANDWDIKINTPVYFNPPNIKYFPFLYFVISIALFNFITEFIYYRKKLRWISVIKASFNIVLLLSLVLSSLLILFASLYTKMYVMWFNENLLYVNPLLLFPIINYFKYIFSKNKKKISFYENKTFSYFLVFTSLSALSFILKPALSYQNNILYIFSFMLYYISLLPFNEVFKIYKK